MSVKIAVSGAAKEAVDRVGPQLGNDLVASRITGLDATLWGPEAEDEASKRLGWTQSVSVSTPLVPDILALRDRLRGQGINHIVLGGMGGSSLAPEVITRTSGVELTVLDSTDPGQVLSAVNDRLETTAVVISSKSGGTVETDSQKRVYEKAFRDAGIDPIERIIVVTDPGSPLDVAARADGYRVFNADPTVGGRYSALTAFGLVPSGLAGVDIEALLEEADAMSYSLALDEESNPGLILGAAIAATRPLKDKLGIVADGTHIVGFGDWIEQLIAESTGKLGKGILPVVLTPSAPELEQNIADLQVIRLVADYKATEELNEGDIEITGTLGALMLTWEYAVVVACSASTPSTSPTSSRRRSPPAACSMPAQSRSPRPSSTAASKFAAPGLLWLTSPTCPRRWHPCCRSWDRTGTSRFRRTWTVWPSPSLRTCATPSPRAPNAR